MVVRLPDFFRVDNRFDLIRLGRDFDGGYLVSQSDIAPSKRIFGFGVNDDWSFERDFTALSKAELVCFDGSVSTKVFFLKVLEAIFRLDKPTLLVKRVCKLVDFVRFFSHPRRKFVEKFVGLYSLDGRFVGVDSVLGSCTEANSVFLKIDIEGAEYRILDSLISFREIFTGLVIEFHDFDINYERIIHFCSDIGLELVNVHYNNNGPIVHSSLLPTVVELTFSRNAILSSGIVVDLNQKNNPGLDYHSVEFF